MGIISMVMVVLVTAACAGESNSTLNERAGEEGEQAEDVTITIMTRSFDDERFAEFIKEPVEDKLPHITIERIEDTPMEDLILTDTVPDIIWIGNQGGIYSDIVEYELEVDLIELAEKHDFDMDRIEPSILTSFINQDPTGKGRLLAMPYNRGVRALYYNKDIFDLFGEPYPEDGMTWKETLELAYRLTGTRNGVDYKGFTFDMREKDTASRLPIQQLPINFTDPETGELLFQEDSIWSDIASLYQDFVNIPGNYPFPPFYKGFIEEGTVAMSPYWNAITTVHNDGNINFDLTTFPLWDGHPDYAPISWSNAYAITATSEHPDEAFEVLAYILSDEAQEMQSSKYAVASPLKDPKMQEVFGEEVEGMQEYNTDAFFKYPPNPGPENVSPYDRYLNPNTLVESIDWRILFDEDMDVNSFLRQEKERLDILIQERIKNE